MIHNSKLIVANWKLNLTSLEEAEKLVTSYQLPVTSSVEFVFLPPIEFLDDLMKKFPKFKWGAQDFTSKDVKADYVLIGHSDQRKKGETDEMVNKKLLAALEDSFNVILAVGEVEKGQESLVMGSLKASTRGLADNYLDQLTVAYEPVWAISTNKDAEPDTPERANKVIERLRLILDTKYLYGGSVDSSNIAGFLSQSNIFGALVGAASLDPEEFSKILEIAA